MSRSYVKYRLFPLLPIFCFPPNFFRKDEGKPVALPLKRKSSAIYHCALVISLRCRNSLEKHARVQIAAHVAVL